MIPFTGSEYKQIINDCIENIRLWQSSHEGLIQLRFWLLERSEMFTKLGIEFDSNVYGTPDNIKRIIEHLVNKIPNQEDENLQNPYSTINFIHSLLLDFCDQPNGKLRQLGIKYDGSKLLSWNINNIINKLIDKISESTGDEKDDFK